MADNETDALLKDLESRASSPKQSASKDEGGEDIEAFLRSLEGDDYVAPPAAPEPKSPAVKTKTATSAPEPATPKAAPDAPMQKAEKPAKPDRHAEKAARNAEKAAEKEAKAAAKQAKAAEKVAAAEAAKAKKAEAMASGELTGPQKVARVAKWSAVVVPLTAAWWLLGAYLSTWVSAGWLVLILATAVVFGLPGALLLGVKKGRYIWWTAGTAALITVGLVAPLPEASSNALMRYGHWPTSALAEVAGLDASSPLMRANAAIGEWVGGWIFPKADDDRIPRKLGTQEPLNPDDVPKPVDPVVPVVPVPPDAVAPDPTVPPAPTVPPTPDPAKPDAPAVDPPTPEVPNVEPSPVEAPKVEAPAVDPKPDAPPPEAPKPDAPKPEAPPSEAPPAN